jgi:hypothetical protein
MEALNQLIKNLGANRVTMSIVANEFEQTPSVSNTTHEEAITQSVLDAIVKTCDPEIGIEDSIRLIKACSGFKLTKKQKDAIQQCWQDDRLVQLNDCLMDQCATRFKVNVVVVIVDNEKCDQIFKGVVCNKNESPTCYIVATHDLIAKSAESVSWLKVKETLIENKWVDALIVGKYLSAAEVKQLAQRMGMESKGMLKKDLVSMICNTLQKN